MNNIEMFITCLKKTDNSANHRSTKQAEQSRVIRDYVIIELNCTIMAVALDVFRELGKFSIDGDSAVFHNLAFLASNFHEPFSYL